MRPALAILGLLAALAAPALAEGPDDNQVSGLQLGQRAPDPSDVGGLQSAFGPIIGNSLKGLMLVETGAPHYLLDLGNDRMLGIWFDGAREERPIYWIDLTWPELNESTAYIKNVDIEIKPRYLVPVHVRIEIDPSLPPTRRAEIKQWISTNLDQHPLETFPANDPYFRLQLLGEQFRGRMVSNHPNKAGKPYIGSELFDGTLARRALGPQAQ
jgi:hypothetical protein